jgi:RNA polymerase sigma-70 factor (ECF subfamily)
MQRQEAQRLLRDVLDRMDIDKRAVFVMYEVEELSTMEIASVLGVPMGTVHSRLHAARKQFELVLSRLQKDKKRGGGA